METTANIEAKSQNVRYWAIAGAIVCVVASYLSIPDVGWEFFQHLFLGRLMIASADIPSAAPWALGVAPDFRLGSTWLFDFLLAEVDLNFGPVWVAIVKQLLLIGVITSWALVFGRLARDRVFGFLLGVILALGILLFNQTTAGMVALALFPWLMLTMQSFLKAPSVRSGIEVFLLSAFYVNIHPSVVGAIVAAILLARIEIRRLPTVIISLFLTTAALFVRPYPLTQFSQFQNQFKAFVGDIAFGLEPVFPSNHELVVLLVLLAGVVFIAARIKSAVRSDMIIAVICFLILGVSCKKYFGFAAVSLGFVIAMLKGDLDDLLQDRFNQAKTKLLSFVDKIPLAAGVFFLFSLAVVFASRTISISRSQLLWPVPESEILSRDSSLFPVANTPEVGSFLAYKLASENTTAPNQGIVNDFLKYADYRFYMAARGLCDLKPGWRDVLSRINPNSVICPVNSPMFFLLSFNPGWKRITTEDKTMSKNSDNRHLAYALFAQARK